jgi:hypothetical protein
MATEDLADLVESLGRTPVMDAIGDDQRGKVQAVPNLAAGAATRILALQGRILI